MVNVVWRKIFYDRMWHGPLINVVWGTIQTGYDLGFGPPARGRAVGFGKKKSSWADKVQYPKGVVKTCILGKQSALEV